MEQQKEFKVVWYLNNTYQVIRIENEECVFQGDLANCESFIRLKENNYL